jgi:hypothetical protein
LSAGAEVEHPDARFERPEKLTMSHDDLGFALIVGTLGVGALIGYLFVHVFQIEWFRERLLSEDRWTRAWGMFPIILPLYIVAGMIFSAVTRSS